MKGKAARKIKKKKNLLKAHTNTDQNRRVGLHILYERFEHSSIECDVTLILVHAPSVNASVHVSKRKRNGTIKRKKNFYYIQPT